LIFKIKRLILLNNPRNPQKMTLAISDTVKIVLSTFRKRKLITKTTIPLRNSKLALVIFLLSVTPFYCFSNIPNSIFKLQKQQQNIQLGMTQI
jgi:hypothetical protein